MHDEEEAKMGAKTGDTVEELRKENARLRTQIFPSMMSDMGLFEGIPDIYLQDLDWDEPIDVKVYFLNPEQEYGTIMTSTKFKFEIFGGDSKKWKKIMCEKTLRYEETSSAISWMLSELEFEDEEM